MVSALDFGSGGLGSNEPWPGTASCSWARYLTLIVPLSTQVYKWVPTNLLLGVTLRWTSIPTRGGGGGVEILLVASCYGNRYRLRPDGPLGSYADFLFAKLFRPCSHFKQSNTCLHPANRASFKLLAAKNWEEKEALHKSRHFFEVAAGQKFEKRPDKTSFLQRRHNFLGKTDRQDRAHSTKTEATFAKSHTCSF